MKTMTYGLFFILFVLLVASGCKKDEDDGPVDESTDWTFDVTITLNDQWGTTYVATGTALYERRGTDFTVTVNYNIGQASYRNIELAGTVNGDQVEFNSNVIFIDFEVGGTNLTEEVTFSLNPVSVAGSMATGSGNVQQRLLPNGALETGTFFFTATKQ
jgi:hypothetical protein